jgi:hypothetical protein
MSRTRATWKPLSSSSTRRATSTTTLSSSPSTPTADPGVAAHFGQFAGVLIALGGFLVLYRLQIRGDGPLLARCASARPSPPQRYGGSARRRRNLKQNVDARADASGPDKRIRFANAETPRWTEWGLQSYFRLLLGLTFVLFGAAIARTGIVLRWLGWIAVLGGLL